MTEEVKQDPREYWKGFPEAPFSDTFKWTDGNGFEHMTTVRGWALMPFMSSIQNTVKHITDSGGKNNKPAQAPAPEPRLDQAPAPAKDEANPTGLSFQVSKLKVTPEIKDGAQRIMVELFAEGHQWADIKAFYSTAEQAAVAFADVTGLDFHVAGEYSINCIADYRLSDKKNTKGNPYKNLVRVRQS